MKQPVIARLERGEQAPSLATLARITAGTGQRLSPRDASRGRDLCPGGNNRTAEEMAAGVDAEAEHGWGRVGLHLKLSGLLDADGLHDDDEAVAPVPGRRCTAEEAGQARVVGEMERSGRQVLAGAVPRSVRESGHRGGDIGEGPVPPA